MREKKKKEKKKTIYIFLIKNKLKGNKYLTINITKCKAIIFFHLFIIKLAQTFEKKKKKNNKYHFNFNLIFQKAILFLV